MVIVSAVIENLEDLSAARMSSSATVRRVIVSDARVNADIFGLVLPKKLIDQLGLEPLISWDGTRVYRAVRLTLQGRDCILDVMEAHDDSPILIGRLPLLVMDWVIDAQGQKLTGNPAHGGVEMIEAYRTE